MTSIIRNGIFPVACALALSGCEEGLLAGKPAAEGEAAAMVAAPGTDSVTRDVEMPEVFETTELALWDGRPSLGGVWIAHPDVTTPERARVRVVDTGKTVEGALFRRERDNPGPRVQVSSAAAAELGLLAGQPMEVAVVVIREEVIEVEAPVAEGLDLPAGNAAPVGDIQVASTDALAGDLNGNAAVEPVMMTPPEQLPPRRKGFWGRFRDSLRNTPEPTVSAGAIASTADIGGEAPMVETLPPVETQSLDPVASVAAAAIAEAESEAAARPGNAFIQVGLFSQEANANAAAATLRQNGIVPIVEPTTVGGNAFWRVTVGPVATASDRTDLVQQIRRLGFDDAYLTSS